MDAEDETALTAVTEPRYSAGTAPETGKPTGLTIVRRVLRCNRLQSMSNFVLAGAAFDNGSLPACCYTHPTEACPCFAHHKMNTCPADLEPHRDQARTELLDSVKMQDLLTIDL